MASKKRLSSILLALAGLFLVAAAVVFAVQWQEGVQAQSNARALLLASQLAPTSAVEEKTLPAALIIETEAAVSTFLETKFEGYAVIAKLDLESLNLSLPVLSATSDQALTVSVCYYSGPKPGKAGNLVITGHNYRNGAHFGRLDQMVIGDSVTVTDPAGNAYIYTVYQTELIKPDQAAALQDTKYDRELTLMTCAQNGNRRLLVRCVLEE